MKITLALIASILAVIGNISYLKDVVKGIVKPHPYTWFIWSIVSMTTFFGGVVKGAGIGALPTGIAEAFTIIIFLFSLKNLFKGGRVHIHKSDHYFFITALFGLIPWIFTKDPTISVIVVVIIDVIAFIPTLRKAWVHPDTERPLLYEMNVSRHVLTLFSLGSYNIATILHSITMICTNAIMVVFMVRTKSQNNKV
jgi:hypothetical protein